MELFEECQKLGMMVFFHSGRAGIEAGNNGEYAKMEKYKEPLAKFKDIQFIFGHAGARDHSEALQLAKQHENVWLETDGQGVTSLRAIAKELTTAASSGTRLAVVSACCNDGESAHRLRRKPASFAQGVRRKCRTLACDDEALISFGWGICSGGGDETISARCVIKG